VAQPEQFGRRFLVEQNDSPTVKLVLTLKSFVVGDDTTAKDSSKSSGRRRRCPEFSFDPAALERI